MKKNYLKIVSSSSDDIDSLSSINHVILDCKKQLNGVTPTAGIVYISIHQDKRIILDRILEEYPDLELIGCSHDGVFSSNSSFDEDAVSLTLFSSNIIDIKAGIARNVSQNNSSSIKESINKVKSNTDQDAKICIVNLPSLKESAVVILNRFKECFDEGFPFFGGAAGDDWNFENTFQFYKNEIHNDAISYLLLSGPLHFGFGVKSGWVGKGALTKITSSESNVVHKIGDYTAVEFYQKHIGEDISAAMEYPLVVYENDNHYLRAPIKFDYAKGSLTFTGDVPKDVNVQVGFTSRDQIINATEQSFKDSLNNYTGNNPVASICFSCAARKQVLGLRTGEEFEIIKSNNRGLDISGFYGYGEIAPITKQTDSKFHNETFVSLTLGLE